LGALRNCQIAGTTCVKIWLLDNEGVWLVFGDFLRFATNAKNVSESPKSPDLRGVSELLAKLPRCRIRRSEFVRCATKVGFWREVGDSEGPKLVRCATKENVFGGIWCSEGPKGKSEMQQKMI
jgi:hypothetical protein